jgi:hypothetical protein
MTDYTLLDLSACKTAYMDRIGRKYPLVDLEKGWKEWVQMIAVDLIKNEPTLEEAQAIFDEWTERHTIEVLASNLADRLA